MDEKTEPPRPIIHRAARRKLEAARRWYEERDPEAAARFAAQVAAALRAIIEAPARWPLYRLAGGKAAARVRRIFVRDFPYSVLYDVTDAGKLRVIAFAHQARRPGYWRTRIRGG